MNIDEVSLDAANEALTTTWQALSDAPVLNRPIGSLVPDRTGRGACTDIDVVNSDVALSISASSGAALPVARDPYDPENAYEPVVELRTLPDGSVLESYDVDLSSSMTAEDGTMRLARSVTLTRPSGVQVSVRSTADFVPGGAVRHGRNRCHSSYWMQSPKLRSRVAVKDSTTRTVLAAAAVTVAVVSVAAAAVVLVNVDVSVKPSMDDATTSAFDEMPTFSEETETLRCRLGRRSSPAGGSTQRPSTAGNSLHSVRRPQV